MLALIVASGILLTTVAVTVYYLAKTWLNDRKRRDLFDAFISDDRAFMLTREHMFGFESEPEPSKPRPKVPYSNYYMPEREVRRDEYPYVFSANPNLVSNKSMIGKWKNEFDEGKANRRAKPTPLLVRTRSQKKVEVEATPVVVAEPKME